MSVTGALGRLLRSHALAVSLLLAIALMAAAGSVLAPKRLFSHPVFTGALSLLAVNVAFCTWHRIAAAGARRRMTARRASDVALHASLILVLAGGAGKGAFGSVRTKLVAVGTETDVMLNWETGREESMGFSLRVDELREERYPARVQLGVRAGASEWKSALLTLEEGKPSRVPGADLELEVDGYDPSSGAIQIRTSSAGRREALLFSTKEGGAATRSSGAYVYSLVAWRSDVKNVRAHLTLTGGGETLAAGWVEPNGRLAWRGTNLFLTVWGSDPYGNPFCGFQAVRDPAAPLFWAGCVLLSISLVWHLALKARLPSPSLERRFDS